MIREDFEPGDEVFGEDEIVCPHCFYEFSDSWEFGKEECGEEECPECGNEFTWTRQVEVSYSTKIKENKGPEWPDRAEIKKFFIDYAAREGFVCKDDEQLERLAEMFSSELDCYEAEDYFAREIGHDSAG